MSAPFVSGLVLAAGGSKRLGQPKQLLAYGTGTLLGHVLATARACEFDELLCVVGAGAEELRRELDFSGVRVVVNAGYGEGCSSSIAAALDALDDHSELLVLMLGDQPGVTAQTVAALLAGLGSAPVAVCAYADGRGHPLAFTRELFGELAALHGDKGVWKMLDRHADAAAEIELDSPIPRDVDTWADYEALVAEDVAQSP